MTKEEIEARFQLIKKATVKAFEDHSDIFTAQDLLSVVQDIESFTGDQERLFLVSLFENYKKIELSEGLTI